MSHFASRLSDLSRRITDIPEVAGRFLFAVAWLTSVLGFVAVAVGLRWAELAALTAILIPGLVWIDGAPVVFLFAAFPALTLFDVPSDHIGGIKVITVIAILTWITGLLLGRQSIRFDWCQLDTAITSLFLVAGFNILLQSNGYGGYDNLIFEYGGCYLLYLFVRASVVSQIRLQTTLAGFVAGAAVVNLWALWQYARGLAPHSEGLVRVGVPGWDIDAFAGVTLAAAALSATFAIKSEKGSLRLLARASLPIFAAAIVLSYSREVFIGLGCIVLAALIVGRGGRVRGWATLATAIAALVAFTSVGSRFGLSTYVSRIAGIGALNYNATSGRNILWSMGLKSFETHPWFGLGIGNFASPQYWYGFAYQQNVTRSFLSATQQVHSFYLGWASDSGLVGLAFLVPALALAGAYTIRSLWMTRSGSVERTIAQGIFLAFVGYFVSQAAAHSQNEPFPYMFLALVASMWVLTRHSSPARFLERSLLATRQNIEHSTA